MSGLILAKVIEANLVSELVLADGSGGVIPQPPWDAGGVIPQLPGLVAG